MGIFNNKDKLGKGNRVYLRKKSHKLHGYFAASFLFIVGYVLYSLKTQDK